MTQFKIGIPNVQQGALDHWVGEVVPLRGTDRRIIGEAKVILVDYRPNGGVIVIAETDHDPDTSEMLSLVDLLSSRASMSFSIPHRPRRDDPVAEWLKRKRDDPAMYGNMDYYWGLDGLLDEYRARADYGLTLDDDMSELPEGY